MITFTAEELTARTGDRELNRIDLGFHELALRYSDVTGRYSRVLYRSTDDALRVEVDLTAKAHVLCEGNWGDVWKYQVRPGMIRIGEGWLDSFDTQYRCVRTGSPLYRRVEDSMLEWMDMQDVNFLTNRNFLPEIDWEQFLLNCSSEPDGRLVCLWQQCRKTPNLQAAFARQIKNKDPARHSLGERVHFG